MTLRPLFSALVALVLIYIVSNWAGAEAPPQPGTLYFGRRARCLSGVFFFLALFVAFAASRARPSQRLLAAVIATCFVLTAVYLVLEFFVTRITFDSYGIFHRNPWRGARRVPWSAINGYRFSIGWGAHIFLTHSYGQLRIDTALLGLEPLRQELVRRCPSLMPAEGSPETTK
jgi:phosphotransferase system  glucose/maltose/N-acetylglucosamine-specific IIC component